MRTVAIIQARMGSSRLPGKVLLPLAGSTVLLTVVRRVQRSRLLDDLVVATSAAKENLPLIAQCAQNGIRVFVGEEEDVLERYYQAARLYRADRVVRITADCPLFDGELLDEALRAMPPRADYLAMLQEDFADGLDLEIVTMEALTRVHKAARLRSEREHVTLYIRNHPEAFRLVSFPSPCGYFGDLRWTLDEPEDYSLIRTVYDRLMPQYGMDFGFRQVLELFRRDPGLARLNAGYERNEGLQRSLAADGEVSPVND